MNINFEEDAPIPSCFLNKSTQKKVPKKSIQTSNDPQQMKFQERFSTPKNSTRYLESINNINQFSLLSKSEVNPIRKSDIRYINQPLENTITNQTINNLKENFEMNFKNHFLIFLTIISCFSYIFNQWIKKEEIMEPQTMIFLILRVIMIGVYLFYVWFKDYFHFDSLQLTRRILSLDMQIIFHCFILILVDYYLLNNLREFDDSVYDEFEILHRKNFIQCTFITLLFVQFSRDKTLHELMQKQSLSKDLYDLLQSQAQLFLITFSLSCVSLVFYMGLETDGLITNIFHSESIADFIMIFFSTITFQQICCLIFKKSLSNLPSKAFRKLNGTINKLQILNGYLQQEYISIQDYIVIDQILIFLYENESVVYLTHFKNVQLKSQTEIQIGYMNDLICCTGNIIRKLRMHLSNQEEQEQRFDLIDIVLGLKSYIFYDNQMRQLFLNTYQEINVMGRLLLIMENTLMKIKHIDNLEFYIEVFKDFLDQLQKIHTDLRKLLVNYHDSNGIKLRKSILDEYEGIFNRIEQFLSCVYPVIYRFNYETYQIIIMQERLLEMINDQDQCLILDGYSIEKFNSQLKEALEKNEEIQNLSLKNCNLKTLRNFPSLTNLSSLDLSNNKFKGKDLKFLKVLQNLQILSLSYCQIQSIDDLQPLMEIPNLLQINIKDCGLTFKREDIFKKFPNLLLLNDQDCFGETLSLSSSEISDMDEELELDSEEFLSSDSSDYSYESEENVKLKLSQFQINNEPKNEFNFQQERNRPQQ